MGFTCRSDLYVERLDVGFLVLVPGKGHVLHLQGADAEAFELARHGVNGVPDHLAGAMAGLVELGVVESNTWDRRRVLQLGGATAAAAVAVIALPSIAAAASGPDPTTPTTSSTTTTTTLPGPGQNWAQQFPATSPPARTDAAMATDGAGNIVLFGGFNISRMGDTWIWNSATATWTQQNPVTSPSARYFASMATNGAGNVVLFGGQVGNVRLDETWVWNGTTWTQRTPAISPPYRSDGVMATDAAGNVVLFGGQGSGAGSVRGYYHDTWVWP